LDPALAGIEAVRTEPSAAEMATEPSTTQMNPDRWVDVPASLTPAVYRSV